MDDNSPEKIIQALKDRRVNLRCPRCAQGEFDLVGFSQLPVSDFPGGVGGDDKRMPVALVVCPVCGFVMQHALVSLGLISEPMEATK